MIWLKEKFWKLYRSFTGLPHRSQCKYYAKRHIFLKEYGNGMTISEIAFDYCVTRERVRQVILKYTRYKKLYEIVDNEMDM